MSMLKRNEQSASEINNWSVYVHINKVNGKKYVGITSRVPSIRWQNGTAYKNNPHFNAAIVKYGWDNFVHIILRTGLSQDSACAYEKEYIKVFRSNKDSYGYNMTDGGEGTCGYHFSKEQREIFHILNSGKNNPCYGRSGTAHPMYGKRGIDNPNHGRAATKEQRENMSIARKGTTFTKEHILHMKLSAKRGNDNPMSKPVFMYNLDGEPIRMFDTATDGAKYSGADLSGIIKCCHGKRKSASGFIWKYAT